MAKSMWVVLAAAGCHSDGTSLPTAPPKQVTMVASGGFSAPTDAVASPDGRDFYFAAFDSMNAAAVFRTSSTPGGSIDEISSGDPIDMPIGLVMACDGKSVYVADMGGDSGAVLSVTTGGGMASDLGVTGMIRPSGLAMAADCKTLYATGRSDDGLPGLFTIPITGGPATAIYLGDPLVSPTGLHVDHEGVAWVMDHLAAGASGEGVLWAIPSDGSTATEVISGLQMGTPGGVSLTAGGGTAVMPTRDASGKAQLTAVEIATGEMTQLPTPDIQDPAGLRSARSAGVFAVVDSEGGAIFRAD